MNQSFDMSEQMRAFAEQGMDQARKAFDSYMDTMQKTLSNVESSSSDMQAKTSEASKKAMTLAEGHMNAAFQQAEKLVKAKDPKEAVELQTAYLKGQMDELSKQAQAMGEDAMKAFQDFQKSIKL